MNKHTPGPWEFLDDHPEKVVYHIVSTVTSTTFDDIASIYRFKNNPHDELANARLIAAAPELLEALEKLYSLIGNDEWFDDWTPIARAAIAKAKGEEQ